MNFTDKPCEISDSGVADSTTQRDAKMAPGGQSQKSFVSRRDAAENAVRQFEARGHEPKSDFARKCAAARYESFLAIENPNPSSQESESKMVEIEMRCAQAEAKLKADKASGKKSVGQLRREMSYDDKLKECVGLKHFAYLVENDKIAVRDGALKGGEMTPEMASNYEAFCREKINK